MDRTASPTQQAHIAHAPNYKSKNKLSLDLNKITKYTKGTYLGCAHLNVEVCRVDSIFFINVVAGRNFARRKSLSHVSAPGDEAQGDN
jgi:hypothetical protein